ncbi:MAG: PD-(D/E)XK nuclease family protein [Pirellulales bacterium]
MKRVFLEWNRPGLAAACEYLIGRFGAAGALDLGRVVVAVPGSRAGRRLLELLVESAANSRLRLTPPEIVTVGRLPELLYRAKRPFAGDLVQQLAWVEAIRRADPRRVKRLSPSVPAADDLDAWLALGEILARLHRELAADALDFSAVAESGAGIEAFDEAQRWEALAQIQQEYLRQLDRLDLWDLQTARLHAIREGECATEAEVVLVGAVDLNRAQRMMLDQIADRVTALVFSPADLAERFDEYGCVRSEAWQDVSIDLAGDQIEVVEDPAEQGAAAVRALAALGGRYRADQLVLGVPDETIVPHLEQPLEQCEIPVRYGVGTPLARTGPYRLLAGVAEYAGSRAFSALAALARHPAVESWLASRNLGPGWLTELDRFASEHLPHDLSDPWPEARRETRLVNQVYDAIERLVAPLDGEPRPLGRWSEPILDLLVAVYGQAPLNSAEEPDRTIVAACDQIRDGLREHLAIPEALAPVVAGAEALGLLLRRLEGGRIAPLANRDVIEMLGWLELPLDDAPALVVTGFNEGVVPSSLNADMFLPNQFRRRLGLEDNDRRYARDAYALAVLAASRVSLKLIAGRKTAQGDPLAPSRLLFACDAETAARRALALFSTRKPAAGFAVPAGAIRAGREHSAFEVPRPAPLKRPITSMRVTEFRDYLACPYRYYLRHCLRLEVVGDAVEELDGRAFGTLAHAVLCRFGQGPAATSADVEEVRGYLDMALNREIEAAYGQSPRAVILVQAEQLRLRLAAFAQWQADWVAKGWRIEHVEVAMTDGQATLAVDDQPMGLRGRIDRIDLNESTGERTIFDYKTSDRPDGPEITHRKNKLDWTDLQLPLYRHLAAGLGIEGPVGLGYILLPKDTSKVGPAMAAWSEEDLQSADAAAAEVVRSVRQERFWPPASPPPDYAEDFARICLDHRFSTTVHATGEEGNGDA